MVLSRLALKCCALIGLFTALTLGIAQIQSNSLTFSPMKELHFQSRFYMYSYFLFDFEKKKYETHQFQGFTESIA